MAAATGTFAQETHFGIKGGISGNWIPKTNINPDDKVLPNTGFFGGVAGSFEFGGSTFVQTELLYARKGISTKSEFDETKYWRKLHYLQLPVVFGIITSDDRMKIMAGPEIGYCIGNKVFEERGFQSPASADDVKKFNFALVIQTTYMILDALGVDLKVDYALTNTFTGNDKGRNLCVQIGLSYWFEL